MGQKRLCSRRYLIWLVSLYKKTELRKPTMLNYR